MERERTTSTRIAQLTGKLCTIHFNSQRPASIDKSGSATTPNPISVMTLPDHPTLNPLSLPRTVPHPTHFSNLSLNHNGPLNQPHRPSYHQPKRRVLHHLHLSCSRLPFQHHPSKCHPPRIHPNPRPHSKTFSPQPTPIPIHRPRSP